MPGQRSDALVLFGATGDLAGKMILPAVRALAARGAFEMPLVAVARREPGALREIVMAGLAGAGTSGDTRVRRLARRVECVSGDLGDPATYSGLVRALRDVHHPLYYLAIPPDLFSVVVEGLARSKGAAGARIAVEKPFGRDLASARALDAKLRAVFPDRAIFRVDHYLAKDPVRDLVFLRLANRWLEPIWTHAHIGSVQITMAEAFGVTGRGRFYDAVGAIRDVVQNHLLELVALLAMEPPKGLSPAALHAARIAALRAIRPLSPRDVVLGQYLGYRDEDGVAPDSRTETSAAMRFRVDAPRWTGVPFCVRTGKRLPLTTTEVWVELKRSPGMPLADQADAAARHLRFRLGPGRVEIAIGAEAKQRGVAMAGRPIELLADLGVDHDHDAYEWLLDAALDGDHALNERAAGVMAAWRVVEPVLNSAAPMQTYAPGTWGPAAADRLLPRGARWHDPVPDSRLPP